MKVNVKEKISVKNLNDYMANESTEFTYRSFAIKSALISGFAFTMKTMQFFSNHLENANAYRKEVVEFSEMIVLAAVPSLPSRHQPSFAQKRSILFRKKKKAQDVVGFN